MTMRQFGSFRRVDVWLPNNQHVHQQRHTYFMFFLHLVDGYQMRIGSEHFRSIKIYRSENYHWLNLNFFLMKFWSNQENCRLNLLIVSNYSVIWPRHRGILKYAFRLMNPMGSAKIRRKYDDNDNDDRAEGSVWDTQQKLIFEKTGNGKRIE